MLLLGLLLVAATGAFTGLLIAGNSGGGPDYTVSVLGNSIATLNSLEIFLSGIALALLFGLGLAMLSGSGRRHTRRRAELRSARRQARDAREERDQLASRMTGESYADPATDPVMAEDPAAAGERDGTRRRPGRHLFGH